MSERILTCRLATDADLLSALTETVREAGITKASVQLIGAVRRAELGFYHQDTKTYETHVFDKPLEIIAGMGNVSIKDGEAFVHLHLCLGDEVGACFGGHAMPGCVVFACEAVIRELPGDAPVRQLDETTGLPLWGAGPGVY